MGFDPFFKKCLKITILILKLILKILNFKFNPFNYGILLKFFLNEIKKKLIIIFLHSFSKDPKDVLDAYDAMITFVRDPTQRYKTAAEMEFRGVKAVTFFDVVLDFILMDAFEDLTAPPSSVLAVINNRWLSNGFKEGVKKKYLFYFILI